MIYFDSKVWSIDLFSLTKYILIVTHIGNRFCPDQNEDWAAKPVSGVEPVAQALTGLQSGIPAVKPVDLNIKPFVAFDKKGQPSAKLPQTRSQRKSSIVPPRGYKVVDRSEVGYVALLPDGSEEFPLESD